MTFQGSSVEETCDTGTPSAGGGIIADGTYNLTAIVGYGAMCVAGTDVDQATLVISGGGTVMESNDAESGIQNQRITTSGTQITLAETCGIQPSSREPYTATTTSLTLGPFNQSGVQTTFVYTLAP